MMKINVQLMTEEAYTKLKNNFEEVYTLILANPTDNSWINDYVNCDLYEKKKYLIDDFELEYSLKYSEVEESNAKMLYEHLNELPKYIICNKRFWAWIIFEKAYRVSQVAMNFTANIIKHFWLGTDSRRDIMLNVMGRQYFKVDVSIEESFEDKYMLTDYIFSNHNLYKNLTYRNIGMLKNVSLAFLKTAYFLNKDLDFKYDDLLTSEFIKHISRLGSVKLIDTIPEDDIMEYLYLKMKDRVLEEHNKKVA